MKSLTAVQKWTLDTLFPRECVGCGATDNALCDVCLSEIVLLKHQQCVRCLKITAQGKTCATCRPHVELDYLLAAAHYNDGPLKEALHTYKYDGRLDLIEVLCSLILANKELGQALESIVQSSKDLSVVPVPLHRKRLWARGFNQSRSIAHRISQHLHIPIDERVVTRPMYSVPQAKLHRQERLKSVEGIFAAPKTSRLQGKTVILVDDIATTGATLNACAAALKEARAKRVIGLVVARAL